MLRMKLLAGLSVLLMMGGLCHAQEKQAQDKKDAASDSAAQTAPSDGRHYQVVFVAQELEGGKVINARRYVTDMALTGPGSASGSIRTGARIPEVVGGSSTIPQFTYVDVGFDVDFNRARLEGDNVFLWITADLNSTGASPIEGTGTHPPTILQNKWSAGVTVPLGKPTVIFSSDDVSSKRTIQIELTVSPVRLR